MGLENVKVGDKVWIGGFKRDRASGTYTPNPWYYRIVESVTAKQFRVGAHRYWIESGKSATGDVATALSIATPQELIDWVAQIKKAREEKEAHEAAQQQAYQGRVSRASRLRMELSPTNVLALCVNSDIVTFEFESHKYRVEEIDND